MPPRRLLALGVVTAGAVLGFPRGLTAQVTDQADTLRQQYRLPVPTQEEAAGIVVSPNPAFSPGASTYRPRSFVLFYMGAAYTPRTRYVNGKHDGNGLIGVTFGNPTRWLGVQADLGFYSTVREGFFERMGLDLEIYRYLPGGLILSLGWENIATRGEPDTGESHYGVVTRWFRLRSGDQWFSSVGFSAGVGNGRYVKEKDWLRGNTSNLNVFGSMTLQVAWPMALVLDWQGDDLTLGAAFTPLKGVPLIITPAVYDVTNQVESGASFMISAIYAVRVK